jgi:hypothetical protein
VEEEYDDVRHVSEEGDEDCHQEGCAHPLL